MIHQLIERAALGVGAGLAVLVGTTTAHAEVLTYDFTANVTARDSNELNSIGFPPSNVITGSFSYDTSEGWYGGSNLGADPSLNLTINQLPPTVTTAAWLTVEYNDGDFIMHEDGRTASNKQVGARIELSGQAAETGSLPSSLSLSGGSGGLLKLFIGGNFSDVDLTATFTSLVRAGVAATNTPELDPASGGAAIVLLLGGAAMIAGDRRRRVAAQFA